MDYYYYSVDGVNTQGPTPQEELITRASQGALTATTQVCVVGGKTWQPISSLLQPGMTRGDGCLAETLRFRNTRPSAMPISCAMPFA